jgi:hypothetical protein
MPPAKKPTTRRTAGRKSGSGPITRREVEAATKRFDKALDDAGTALQSMGSNFGRNAKSTYREIERALTQLRRDAGKANKNLMKDLEKVWSTAGSATSTAKARTTRSTGGSRSRSTAAKSSSAKKSTARKSTTSRSKSSSGAKSSATKSSGTRRKTSSRAKKSS